MVRVPVSVKNHILYKATCLILASVAIFSAFMLGSYAWYSDFSKINEFVGAKPVYQVTLQKYEKDINDAETKIPVDGAVFLLYRQDDPGDNPEQIGDAYTTKVGGRIIVDLPEGRYYFEEILPPPLYEFDKEEDGSSDKKIYEFDVEASTGKSNPDPIIVYNKRIASSLSITKTVNYANADEVSAAVKATAEGIPFEFTVDIGGNRTYKYTKRTQDGEELKNQVLDNGKLYLKHGETATFEKLPLGMQYTVTETSVDGFRTSSEKHHGNVSEEGISCTFTNTYDGYTPLTGELNVKKLVSGAGAETDKEFKFKVTFTGDGVDEDTEFTYYINDVEHKVKSGAEILLKHGESAKFVDLPFGIAYKVEEIISTLDYVVSKDGDAGTITGEPSTALFVNTKTGGDKVGSLVISNTVTGAGDRNKNFVYKVTFTGDGVDEDTEFTYYFNGVEHKVKSGAEILLKHGESVMFVNLPEGLEYTVQQITTDGYTTTVNGVSGLIGTGEIEANKIARVDFVNHIEPDLGTSKLIIEKKVVGVGADMGKEFDFQVFINGEIFKDGEESTFPLKHGERKEIELNVGDVYSVQELDYISEGYKSSITRGFGTATETDVTAEVTNAYIAPELADIEIEKEWKQAEQGVRPDKIVVYLKSGDVRMYTKEITASMGWKHTFNVPKFDSEGREFAYTVVEEEIVSFVSEVKPNGKNKFRIINTYVQPAVLAPLKVEKVITGETPTETADFNFALRLKDNSLMPGESSAAGKTITIKGAGEGVFSGITYTNPGIYEYTISETNGDPEDGYTYDQTIYTLTVTVVEKNGQLEIAPPVLIRTDNNKVCKYSDGVKFTNIYKKPTDHNEMIKIKGAKTWVHDGNAGAKPESIVITLLADGKEKIQKSISVTEHWSWGFSVQKYDDNGKEIVYTIVEEPVPGYKTEIRGYDITNTYIGNGGGGGGGEGDPLDPNPNTGGSNDILLWMSLMATSTIGFAFILLFGRKKKYLPKYVKG